MIAVSGACCGDAAAHGFNEALGKAEVGSSILPGGTMFPQRFQGVGETPRLLAKFPDTASMHIVSATHPFGV